MKKVEIFFSPNLTLAYRSQYGSVNPAGIIAPTIVATFVSTLTAVVYCKVKDRKVESLRALRNCLMEFIIDILK